MTDEGSHPSPPAACRPWHSSPLPTSCGVAAQRRTLPSPRCRSGPACRAGGQQPGLSPEPQVGETCTASTRGPGPSRGVGVDTAESGPALSVPGSCQPPQAVPRLYAQGESHQSPAHPVKSGQRRLPLRGLGLGLGRGGHLVQVQQPPCWATRTAGTWEATRGWSCGGSGRAGAQLTLPGHLQGLPLLLLPAASTKDAQPHGSHSAWGPLAWGSSQAHGGQQPNG